MINFKISQLKTLQSKELKDAFRDKWAMFTDVRDVSAMMIVTSINLASVIVKGVAK